MTRITLATLPQATAQEVFDQAVSGVIAQGGPSRNARDGCVYRTLDGRGCSAGQVCSEEEANALDAWGESTGNDTDWGTVTALGKAPLAHKDLIRRLQQAHDEANVNLGFVKEFTNRCRFVGYDFDLNTAILDAEVTA